MSEPCRHEREFAGTQADTLTSFVKSNAELVKAQSEVKALRATLAKVAAKAFESPILLVLRDNPKLVAYLTAAGKEPT